MFLLAVGVMCLTACAQKKGGERGPRQGGHMVINKDSDSVFAALKQETLGKFKQLTYNDKQTGKTMEYNLLVPEGAEAGQKLPLVLFMADASTAGKEVTAPLTQGYGETGTRFLFHRMPHTATSTMAARRAIFLSTS